MYDFPSSPVENQEFTPSGGVTYIYNLPHWTVKPTSNAGTALPLMDAAAAVGTSMLFARQDHVHPSDAAAMAVRFDVAQGLTATQQQQARQNAYAAPFDALAYSGMQINGGAEVSQENGTSQMYGGAGGTTVTKYIADGWIISSIGGQSISYGANTGQTSPPPGYQSYAAVWTNTANASPAAGDFLFIRHMIEGYRGVARLAWGTVNAQPISIGFWFSSARTGTFSGAVRNSAGNRSYVFTFVVNAANTWEWKTVTIPGDTIGTWLATNGLGIEVDFTLMAGSSYQTAAGVWTAGNYIGAPGTINSISTTAGISFIVGLIVLPGLELPSATRASFTMRPCDREFPICQRYWRGTRSGTGIAYSTTQLRMFIPHFGMRSAPTITLAGPIQVSDVYTGSATQSVASLLNPTPLPDSSSVDFDSFAGLTSSRFYSITQASNLVKLDARL